MLRHPQPRGAGASSALQKASALLKGGGRPSGTGPAARQAQSSANSDENDITSYLAGLAQRTSSQANGRATHNTGSEGVRQAAEPGSAGSKFLKKKTVSAVPEDRAQDKDVDHLHKRAPSISAQQAAPRTDSSVAQGRQRLETAIAGSSSSLFLSRDSDGGLGRDSGTSLSAITASQRSPSAGGPAGQRFLKQSQLQLPASPQPGVALVPPRGQSTSLPMHSTALRGSRSQRSGLDSSDEGMTTLMEGLTTNSNSARTSEEFGPDGPPSHMMRPALSTNRGQKGIKVPQPSHVAGARVAAELPTTDAARRPATAPVAATPAAAFRASSARLNASAGRTVSSSPEPESIADDEDVISDRHGTAESPRPSEAMLSARSSSAPSETTTPRAVQRVRLLDMDDLAAAAASEADYVPPAVTPFFAAARGRLSGRDGGGLTAAVVAPSSRPVPPAPSAGVRQSGADSPTAEEIASSVSTSSSDESVLRPAVTGKPKPRPDSASSRKGERQSPRWQQPQQHSEAATETYSEDFDDSAASELRSAHARRSSSSTSVRSGSRGRMTVEQRRHQQSRHRRRSSSSPDRSATSRRSRRSTAASPRRHDRSRSGSVEGTERRGGRRSGSSATNSARSDGDIRDGGIHGRSRTYSYGSETWNTATPSPRRQERLGRRPHAGPSRSRSHSLSSLSSYTSSDAKELSRRSQRRAFEESPRQRPSRDASPPRSRSQPHRRQRQQHAAAATTTATKVDACLQTGLDLEEAILRCHWNSPGAAFAQFRLSTAASVAVAAAAPECPSGSTVLQMNGLGLPSATGLSDLLARQVALTRDFIETQKRLHQCLLTNLECSEYQYTTLEETKQYIVAHRKPRLTFDEAVRLVKEDMNVQ